MSFAMRDLGTIRAGAATPVLVPLIFSVLLSACSGAAKPDESSPSLAAYQPNIGKSYWIKSALKLKFCPKPDPSFSACDLLDKGRKVHIDGVVQGSVDNGITVYPSDDAFYQTSLDDGRTGYVIASDLDAAASDVDPATIAPDCRSGTSAKSGCRRGK
jgi:hypothetical protein